MKEDVCLSFFTIAFFGDILDDLASVGFEMLLG